MSGASSHLIELFLPLYDNQGRRFPPEDLGRVREELADRFGGVTVFSRAPAEGVWREGGETEHDQIVVFEVMADRLDRNWWSGYRRELERRFRQEEVLIRASAVAKL